MYLFDSNISKSNDLHLDFSENALRVNALAFIFESKSPSIKGVDKQIFSNGEGSIFGLPEKFDCPNDYIDEIYHFLYGKSIDELYANVPYNASYEEREMQGPLEWTKERVLCMNWNLFLASIYTYYVSQRYIESDVWSQIKHILLILKELELIEWKRILFGKTSDFSKILDDFWQGIERLVIFKTKQLLIENASYAKEISYIKMFVKKEEYENLLLFAYNEFIAQVDEELQRLKNLDDIKDKYLNSIYTNLDYIEGEFYTSIFKEIGKFYELRNYISSVFIKLGNLAATLNKYQYANECYVHAKVISTDTELIKSADKLNKNIIKFVPRKDRVNEARERHQFRREEDQKYFKKISKIKEIIRKIFVPLLVICLLCVILFLLLTTIGLFFSETLFAFSWKVLLASLLLAAIIFILVFCVAANL